MRKVTETLRTPIQTIILTDGEKPNVLDKLSTAVRKFNDANSRRIRFVKVVLIVYYREIGFQVTLKADDYSGAYGFRHWTIYRTGHHADELGKTGPHWYSGYSLDFSELRLEDLRLWLSKFKTTSS